jgi:Two component regulator propeller
MVGNSLRRAVISALVLCWTSIVSLGQQYSFRDYVDGLGNLSVNGLLQDREGFLWIGTESGLYQYDGSRFWKFGVKDGLPSEFVRALTLDRDGRLWIGTRDGLAFRGGQRTFSTVTYQQQNLTIPYDSGLASSREGKVYAVTQFGVLVVKSDDGGHSWKAVPLLAAGKSGEIDPATVSSVLVKPGGEIVIGCGKGLCEIAHGKLLKYGAPSGLPEDDWKCLLLKAN